MNKTHWKKLTNPNYLGSWCFQPGEEKVVTIREVKQEIIQNQNGKEECTVAYFMEDIKPLILNKTNSEMIARVLGTPYIEDWKNNKIILRVKKVSAFGDMVDAVRVGNRRPVADPILCEKCGKPIDERLASATMQKYKQKLCRDCAKEVTNND